MRALKSILNTALAVTLAAPVAAETIYDCRARHRSSDNWTPARVIFIVDEAKQSALVIDGLIQHVVGKPVPASLERRSASSYEIRWRVDNVPSRGVGTYDVRYSAVLNPERMRFSVDAVVGGLDNDPRSEGRCKLSK